jgi:mannose-6-phosphate isomerase-like protein (cupin superfamily)
MASGLETYTWDAMGYSPLVFSDGWQVALLNWEPTFEPANLGEVERHLETDEVFVLLRGRAVLFTWTDAGEVGLADMVPGMVYNVRAGVWHNLLSTKDAAWVIVENRDTHVHDTHLRQMTEEEQAQLQALLSSWIEEHQEKGR